MSSSLRAAATRSAVRGSLRRALGRIVGGWPIWLDRIGLGRVVGRHYAVIASIGRRSGRPRQAAVMVLREDNRTGEILVVAGDRLTHWYRNVCAAPATEIWHGGHRFRPLQRLLSTAEIADLLTTIRRERPREARIQCAFFGWPWHATPEQLRTLAASLGGVAFRPRIGADAVRAVPRAPAGTPESHVRRLAVRDLSRWPRATAYLAPIWSLGYGLLALSWALGAAGYPFSEAVDPDARLSLLGSVAPRVGAAGLATLSLLGAVMGAAMLRGLGRGLGRRLAMGFGAFSAVAFAVLLPDLRVLMVLAYAPIFLVGAPFGWPPGVSLASVFTWPVVHQLVVMAGGVIWAGATIRYRRRTAGACERCGRAPSAPGEREVTWPARWGRRAVGVAVIIPLLYAATRWAWALGIPLGLPVDDLRAGDDVTWVGGALLASVAVLGALLTTGLVRRWGEILPAWVPVLGRRRIPPGLAIVPAALMAIVITSAGLAFVRSVLIGEMPFRMDDWGLVGPTLLWPVWGVALGVATLEYHYRRRGRCRTCGRGGSKREQLRSTTPDANDARD